MALQNSSVSEACGFVRLTATGNVSAVQARLAGILCSTTSSGTVVVYDSATTTTTIPITGTITLTAGQFYPIPARCQSGVYVVVGGTADVTVFFDA
jgi:hypothetical protein